MARPRGDARGLLANAARELVVEGRRGATSRELIVFAQLPEADAYHTVRDMARSGELVPVGTLPVAGSNRPMVLYAPPDAPVVVTAADAAQMLYAALAGWVPG